MQKQTLFACLVPAVLLAAPASAAMPSISPHRAIYDLELDTSRASTGTGDIKGRLVFEATGTPCEGFTVNTRFVTQVIGAGGSLVNDLRSATWEAGDGSSYRFITKNYLNRDLKDETDGSANRADDGIDVELTLPQEDAFELASEVLFPSQHVRRILAAAEAGDRIVTADIYDGSDTGRKTFYTTTVIGVRRAPAGEGAETGDDAGENVLGGLASWPVTIGYFDADSENPDIPTYEFSYELYANGVSRQIVLDYGDFVLTGDLSELQILEAEACDQ